MATVLVVDDESGLRTVMSNILKSEGYNVITAEDGKKAIDAVKLSNPDLIFLDIRLPDMDGLQILEEVKKINPGIPVIMCSGFSDVESAVHTVKMGAFDYISKPFKREEVIKSASKALEARRIPAPKPTVVEPKEGVEVRPAGEVKKPVNIIPAVIGIICLVLVVFGFSIVKNLFSGRISVYSVPYANPTALAWDGKNLWASDWVAQSIYKHNIDDKLSISSVFSLPGSHPTGLTYDGNYLWSCDSWARKIYKRNVDANLSEIVSYTSPGPEPSALYWDGVNLWCCDSKTQKIYKLKVTPTGINVENEYSSPCRLPVGMFSDKGFFWVADSETNRVYKLNLSDLSLVDIYYIEQQQEKGSKLAGMTYDGKNIWICSDGMQKIYKLSQKSLKKIK